MKADLSTFNIEIVQISKRIAPKSGLRWPAPHSPPPPQPALRRACLTSTGLVAPGWAPPPAPAPRGNRSLLAASLPGRDLGLVPLLARWALRPAGGLPGLGSPDARPAPHCLRPGRGPQLVPASLLHGSLTAGLWGEWVPLDQGVGGWVQVGERQATGNEPYQIVQLWV